MDLKEHLRYVKLNAMTYTFGTDSYIEGSAYSRSRIITLFIFHPL